MAIQIIRFPADEILAAYTYEGIIFEVTTDAIGVDLKIRAEVLARRGADEDFVIVGTKRQNSYVGDISYSGRNYFKFNFDGFLQSVLSYDLFDSDTNAIFMPTPNSIAEFYIRFVEEYRNNDGFIQDKARTDSEKYFAVNMARQIDENYKINEYVMALDNVPTKKKFLTKRPRVIFQRQNEKTQLSFICKKSVNNLSGIIEIKRDGVSRQISTFFDIVENFRFLGENLPFFDDNDEFVVRGSMLNTQNGFKMQNVKKADYPGEIDRRVVKLKTDKSFILTPKLLGAKKITFNATTYLRNNYPIGILATQIDDQYNAPEGAGRLIVEGILNNKRDVLFDNIITAMGRNNEFQEVTVFPKNYEYVKIRLKKQKKIRKRGKYFKQLQGQENFNIGIAEIKIEHENYETENNFNRFCFNISDIFMDGDEYADVFIQTLNDEGEPVIISEKFRFYPERECVKDKTRFYWLNTEGGFDDYTFTGSHQKKTKVKREEYKKEPENNRFFRGRANLSIESSDEFTVFSVHETDENMRYLMAIYESPEVYVEENGKIIPVIVETNGQDYKSEKLLQVKLMYTKANNKLIQNG